VCVGLMVVSGEFFLGVVRLGVALFLSA